MDADRTVLRAPVLRAAALHPCARQLFAAITITFLTSLLATAPAHAQRTRPETERMELEVGEQVTVPAANVASYSEGAPGVVDVRLSPDGSQFIVVALRPGTTSLLLIYEDGRQVRYAIQVLDPQASVTATGGVPVRENIRLDLYFVQLQDQYSHQIGIGFPGSIGGPSIGRFTARYDILNNLFDNATATIQNQALPRLDIAQSSGWVRLLRQAMLVTANGQEAVINAGGEVNVQITSALTTGVERIEFGSMLTVTPRYDSGTRRIEIAIQADMSELTPSETGIPGRTRTVLNTTVNLELGQAIMLGGLTSRTSRASQTGLPGLSQIPILGVLFGSNARADDNVESMLFIVPTVVQAVPRAQTDRIAEALRIYESYGAIVGGPNLGDIELIEPSPPGYE